jgi:hypothetical protein
MSPKIKSERNTEASQGRELHEARREIKSLRKLVGRLQKTIQKYERERGIMLVLEEADPEPAAPEAERAPVPDPEPVVRCPKCGGSGDNLSAFRTPGGKTLIRCKVCRIGL